MLIFNDIWQQEEAQQSSGIEEVKENKGDKEKKKEEFFDGKSEVGTSPIVTLCTCSYSIVLFVCLKKKLYTI